jgi:predicted SprT family Zn-dependent metalloprotease
MRDQIAESANYDLFANCTPQSSHSKLSLDDQTLPDLSELYRMFDIYNKQYFDGQLPNVVILWSKRMLAAGAYYVHRKEIRLSEKYHHIFPDEVYDTLKHEMIHILYPRHDAPFKEMAGRIGASIRANAHPSLRRPPKYLYYCPECRTKYPRSKRFRMASCGRCSKGGYNDRYKLKLTKQSDQDNHL